MVSASVHPWAIGKPSGVLDFDGPPLCAGLRALHERDTLVRTISRSEVKQPVNARRNPPLVAFPARS